MGEAADDVWDAMLHKQMDFDVLMRDIRDTCNHPESACRLVHTEYEDEDDWFPYQCVVCRQKFDYP